MVIAALLSSVPFGTPVVPEVNRITAGSSGPAWWAFISSDALQSLSQFENKISRAFGSAVSPAGSSRIARERQCSGTWPVISSLMKNSLGLQRSKTVAATSRDQFEPIGTNTAPRWTQAQNSSGTSRCAIA